MDQGKIKEQNEESPKLKLIDDLSASNSDISNIVSPYFSKKNRKNRTVVLEIEKASPSSVDKDSSSMKSLSLKSQSSCKSMSLASLSDQNGLVTVMNIDKPVV